LHGAEKPFDPVHSDSPLVFELANKLEIIQSSPRHQ
jgi:hypothetical protein